MAKRTKKTPRKKESVWAQAWAFCVAAWTFCAKTLPRVLPFLPIIVVLAAALYLFHLTKTEYLTKTDSQSPATEFLSGATRARTQAHRQLARWTLRQH